MSAFFSYFWGIRSQVLALSAEHIQLTVLTVTISVLIGVPIGIIISRIPKLAKPVLGLANLTQAIPSLAMLGFLIPYLGIGTAPALFCVIVYSLLPIIKNTCTGLKSVDSDTLEAATGIGLTKMQVLLKVQLPLALPVIMAGIRIAAVTAVGLVTIAAFIGAGGLGYLVYSGIQTSNNYMILSGAIPACVLALAIDFVAGILEKFVTPISLTNPSVNMTKERLSRSQAKHRIVAAVSGVLIIGLIGATVFPYLPKTGYEIHIGSANYTEQLILGNIYSDLVEEKTDISVVRDLNLGGSGLCYEALESGNIDMYIEYTGTAYGNILQQEFTTDKDLIYSTVCTLMSEKGIKAMDLIGFNNTYVLAIRKDTSENLNINTLSDIAKSSSQLIFAPTIEFNNSDYGIKALNDTYNVNFKSVTPISSGLRYTALDSGQCDVITAFSTDGLLQKYDLILLDDDKSAFLPYYAFPLVRQDTLDKYPELEDALNAMKDVIDEETMQQLNYKVDEEGMSPEDVAHSFLVEKGIIK